MDYPFFRKRKSGQPDQVRRRRKTANWILATGGNHDPRKATGTQQDADMDNNSGLHADAATLEKQRGTASLSVA
jgi:hypothetical protein